MAPSPELNSSRDASSTTEPSTTTPPESLYVTPLPRYIQFEEDDLPLTRSERGHHHVTTPSSRRRGDGNRSRKRSRRLTQQVSDDLSYCPKGGSERRTTIPTALVTCTSCIAGLLSVLLRLSKSESFARMLQLSFRHKWVLLPAFLGFYLFLQVNLVVTFGLHPIEGGVLGRKLDRIMVRRVMAHTYRQQEETLNELGIQLPKPRQDPRRKLGVDTNAVERELLIRRETRSRTLNVLQSAAEDYPAGCTPYSPTMESSLLPEFLLESFHSNSCRIPSVLFVPRLVSWQRQRPGTVDSFDELLFDDREMRELVEDVMPELLKAYDDEETTMDDKIHLWALCAVYYYGGVFVGDRLSIQQKSVEDLLTNRKGILGAAQDSSPIAVAMFENVKTTAGKQMSLLAATPRHPHLQCVLNRLEREARTGARRIFDSLFLSSNSIQSSTNKWNRLTTHCGYDDFSVQKCCDLGGVYSIEEIPATNHGDMDEASKSKGQLYLQLLDAKLEASLLGTAVASVDIQQDAATPKAPMMRPKVTMESRMKRHQVLPGWLCTRCLKSPLFGSLADCGGVCPSGYEDLMCRSSDAQEKTQVDIKVTVKDASSDASTLIPRIIHQTYFEDVSLDRYPHLARLQNSWKASGWEYRFYTDETAKAYILKNFPSRFADAFDALIPGAYKADFFRYLVLMKDGGVYADVDVLLDTTLDTFVTPTMSFFAARDYVGDYAGEPFCLWNGLVGAAPGHPFTVRAVERLVNLILDRADVYDMERDICRRTDQPVDVWKVKEEPLLLFSGPCALGVGANEAMNRTSLESFDLGWLSLQDVEYGGKRDHGDALILLADKFDTGSFRFSDPERDIIVASTELPGIVKSARSLANPTEGERRRQTRRKTAEAHYSRASRGSFVWGRKGVYKDDFVANERLEFNVRFDSVN